MKKLGKLSINPEKVIKNEELVNLKGGYLDGCVYVKCYSSIPGSYLGDLCCPDDQDYTQICRDYYNNPEAVAVFIRNSSYCGC